MAVGHKKQWEVLKKKYRLGGLAHAYLFTGSKEAKKDFFAINFVKFVSCLSKETLKNEPCLKCENCIMIEKGIFPDFKIIEKKEEKNEIEISQIREAQLFLSFKSYYGSMKVVLINEADKMNKEAQSCFLKTLEEPRGNVLILLLTSKPDLLLPTIFSRCQTIRFSEEKQFDKDFEMSEREEKILKNFADVVDSNLADKFRYVKLLDFDVDDPAGILLVLQKYFRQAMLAEIGLQTKNRMPFLLNKGKYPILRLKKAIELVDQASNKICFNNANPKLALEVLLMEI